MNVVADDLYLSPLTPNLPLGQSRQGVTKMETEMEMWLCEQCQLNFYAHEETDHLAMHTAAREAFEANCKASAAARAQRLSGVASVEE